MNKDINRMKELMHPIDQQIMMCDTREDMIMMASCMLIYAKDILDQEIGTRGRKQMFKDFCE